MASAIVEMIGHFRAPLCRWFSARFDRTVDQISRIICYGVGFEGEDGLSDVDIEICFVEEREFLLVLLQHPTISSFAYFSNSCSGWFKAKSMRSSTDWKGNVLLSNSSVIRPEISFLPLPSGASPSPFSTISSISGCRSIGMSSPLCGGEFGGDCGGDSGLSPRSMCESSKLTTPLCSFSEKVRNMSKIKLAEEIHRSDTSILGYYALVEEIDLGDKRLFLRFPPFRSRFSLSECGIRHPRIIFHSSSPHWEDIRWNPPLFFYPHAWLMEFSAIFLQCDISHGKCWLLDPECFEEILIKDISDIACISEISCLEKLKNWKFKTKKNILMKPKAWWCVLQTCLAYWA